MRLTRLVRLIAVLVAALAGCMWGAIDSAAAHSRRLRSEVVKLRADHDERSDVLARSVPPPYRSMLRGALLGAAIMLLILVLWR